MPIIMPGVHTKFLKFFMNKSESNGLKILDMGAGHGAFSKKLTRWERLTSYSFVSLNKDLIMNASEIKLKIFRQVDALEKTSLEDFYGIFVNFINGKKDIDDWAMLSDNQKQGIIDAIEEIDSGKGTPHNKVINKFRKKYSNV